MVRGLYTEKTANDGKMKARRCKEAVEEKYRIWKEVRGNIYWQNIVQYESRSTKMMKRQYIQFQ